MIPYSELKKGTTIEVKGQPYEIIESHPLFKGRGHSVLQSKLRNLITGEVISLTFHPSDSFEEAEISKFKAEFIYSHRGKFVFAKKENPRNRFEISEEQLGETKNFLKQGQEVEALLFKDKIVNIHLPIKIQLKVIEAPPGIKGNRAQPGTKQAVLETGAKINVPLFIEAGDIIEINTENLEYVRRIEKGN